MRQVLSWGRVPRVAQSLTLLRSRFDELPQTGSAPVLAFGQGRSYGDSCLNENGTLLGTRGLDRFIAFDETGGMLRCEAGVTLDELLQLIVPRGWFLPVTPGTRFITVGGAIANDVHGKNHHRLGSFGDHVRQFELLRSDGRRLQCSPSANAELYRATIGGLGLTGLITHAELALRRIAGPWIEGQTLAFGNLGEFLELSAASDRGHEYTVAWVDGTARGPRLGRGIFFRANHAERSAAAPPTMHRGWTFPVTPPASLINPLSVRAFNACYYGMHRSRIGEWVRHYRPFFYPLDGIVGWNRAYGPRGFYQYQCVVPRGVAAAAIAELLDRIAASGQGSMLSVLKTFGDRQAPGLMSFARPGVTLAMDFANRGASTLRLLDELDGVVTAAGGAVYIAKDARMSPQAFARYYPGWTEFARHVDPRFSSSFWRRVIRPAGNA